MVREAPSLALIVTDCRTPNTATGTYGIYEGDMPVDISIWNHKTKEWDLDRPISDIPALEALGILSYDEFLAIAVKQTEEAHGVTFPLTMDQPNREEILNTYYKKIEEVQNTTSYYFTMTNPRILLADGSYIWGYECWWKPVKEQVDGDKLAQLVASSQEQVKTFCEQFVKALESSVDG